MAGLRPRCGRGRGGDAPPAPVPPRPTLRAQVQAQYALADVSTIKEVFLLRYLDQLPLPPPPAAAAAKAAAKAAWEPPASPSVADERPPELRRGDSAHGLALSRAPSGGAGGRGRLGAAAQGHGGPGGPSPWGEMDEEELLGLAKELCERLAPAGRPAVSVWQLHRLVDTPPPPPPYIFLYKLT